MALDLFKDIINSILYTKKHVLLTNDDEKTYNSFIVGRSLSYHQDCVILANEMNQRHSLDRRMQYDFLLEAIRRKKREFAPWHKKEKEDEFIEIIKVAYGISTQKAKEALRLLSKDQLAKLKQRVSKGGIK